MEDTALLISVSISVQGIGNKGHRGIYFDNGYEDGWTSACYTEKATHLHYFVSSSHFTTHSVQYYSVLAMVAFDQVASCFKLCQV